MKDYIGHKFGILTVLSFSHKKNNRHYYNVKCDCGNEKIVCLEDMRVGDTLSCGCLHKKQLGNMSRTHGESKTRLYKIWTGIRKRCLNPSSSRFEYYGGRGIRICSDWNDFTNFKSWSEENGYSDNLSIDRIDVNGNYTPENCRWADKTTQSNNTRTNHYLEYKGERRSMMDWCRKLDLSYYKIRSRINAYGWSVERAFETK